MSPKSGKAGSLVAPAEPAEALEADKADPGAVAEMKAEQAQSKSGKYGSEKVKPFTPSEDEEKKTSWIEIELLDDDDKPVPGEPFRITVADGRVYTGTLDHRGFYRLEGLEPGTCKVSFPGIEGRSWKKA